MKKQKILSENRFLKAIVAVLVILILIGVGFLIHNHYSKKNTQLTSSTSGSGTNSNNSGNNSNDGGSGNNSTTPTPSANASPASNVTVTVTSVRPDPSSSGIEQVGTLIGGATSGNCELSLSQSGQQTITQTETVEQQNNAYICPVFNVTLTPQLEQGKWNVNVTVTSDGSSATGSWVGNPVSL